MVAVREIVSGLWRDRDQAWSAIKELLFGDGRPYVRAVVTPFWSFAYVNYQMRTMPVLEWHITDGELVIWKLNDRGIAYPVRGGVRA